MTYIAIYLFISALCLSWHVVDDDYDGYIKVLHLITLPLLAPFYLAFTLFEHPLDRLSEFTQFHIFFYFIFNRKELIFDDAVLNRMREITLNHRNTKSLRHRIWRLAEKAVFKANKKIIPNETN